MSALAPVDHHDLHSFTVMLLEAAGLNPAQAVQVADVLIWADLRGTGSHGVSRLPLYLRWLASGEMRRDASIEVVLQLPAFAMLDAGRGPGAVGMGKAVEQSIQLARDGGVGIALLRNTTHTGALGYYTQAIAAQGLVGMAVVASGPMMGYHGAARPAVSTSPISIAAPRGAGVEPLVFDMATSVVSLGKLMQVRKAGQAIPAGWALDAHGQLTTDADAAVMPAPLGGPKGSGLALMVEVLASILSGNPILAPGLSAPPGSQPQFQNAFVLALDVARIDAGGHFFGDMEDLVTQIKKLPVAHGMPEVLLPGERGTRESRSRQAAGIMLPPSVRDELALVARSFDVKLPW
ncbi:Ldh family oxidoreductase [Polaromonas jejuensis]|uniref:Ldh family oxidoreductase n=1 Tax=Polaromonas jejuensis TaxID=457502 RepID=A0ABW0Q7I1_9BURK|nr:Ldh family oxidoreductase [Polaromonas jejuensis]